MSYSQDARDVWEIGDLFDEFVYPAFRNFVCGWF